MKPTSIQKEVIETTKRLVSYWLSTNDLDSSSHITIIEDEIYAIDGLSSDDQVMISSSLIELFKTIKYLST